MFTSLHSCSSYVYARVIYCHKRALVVLNTIMPTIVIC